MNRSLILRLIAAHGADVAVQKGGYHIDLLHEQVNSVEFHKLSVHGRYLGVQQYGALLLKDFICALAREASRPQLPLIKCVPNNGPEV